MSAHPAPLARAAAALAALALAGLASSCLLMSRRDPTRFYTLTATVEPSPSGRVNPGVGLGPITLPGYLRQAGLATRVDANRVEYAEFARWAGTLHAQFQNALGQDLASLLGTERIVQFPWYPDTPLDVAVGVDVLAFETDAGGTARLDARWTIRDPRTAAVLHGDRSLITEAAEGRGADAEVAALSRALGELARRIAGAIPVARR